MRNIILTIISLITTSNLFAQSPDKALARVKYSFIHIQDTTQKDRPYTENMVLVTGKNASLYISYDKVNQNIEGRKQLEQMKNGGSNMVIKGYSPNSMVDYFYFAKEKKLFTTETLINKYLVEEEFPNLNWKITRDTLSFSGIHCKKATAYFKGRNWIAWFAPEMPFQSGPWKLNGLPGLIIEAFDETGTVRFQFAGMEDAKSLTDNLALYLGNEIKIPANTIKATRKELDKLKEAKEKDPQGFMKTQMSGGVSTVVVSGTRIGGSSVSAKAPLILNNPLELPEKK